MAKRTTFTEAEIAFLNAQRVAHLATADAEGSPHVIPVCYACDGQHFYIAIDEKPKNVAGSQLRRVRNIEARSEASLVIDRYSDDWTRLGYILVHGRADLLAPDVDANTHAHALQLLRKRYPQYRKMALEHNLVIAITPDSIIAWGSLSM